ncbi:12670_t:CDS:2, partial [Racocetra fulgida]
MSVLKISKKLEDKSSDFDEIINTIMSTEERTSLSDAFRNLCKIREEAFEEFNDIIDEKNRTIEALINTNNILSTESNGETMKAIAAMWKT